MLWVKSGGGRCGGTEMDVGQIREERKMVISLWGPGSQAVSPPAGPQLAENSAQYKKKVHRRSK